jgi:hypothetical protein
MTAATEAQKIYLAKINEAVARLRACDYFLDGYSKDPAASLLEAAVLQMRKALEAVAYAAIAPNKAKYEQFRARAEIPADYRKDYNARAILQHLAKVNADFYPAPLLPATQAQPGHWHFGQKTNGYLTKAKFMSFYDRLGKFLHADNPWGNDKGVVNLVADLPVAQYQLRELLALHRVIIRAPDYLGVWVVEVPTDGRVPHIIAAQATGEFAVAGSGS